MSTGTGSVGIDGLRITGPNVDTLLADYRAAWKQFSTATLLPSPASALARPRFPASCPVPSFSRRTSLAHLSFFQLPLCPLFATPSRCRLDRRVLPSGRGLSPRGEAKEGVGFYSFLASVDRFRLILEIPAARARRNRFRRERILTSREHFSLTVVSRQIEIPGSC